MNSKDKNWITPLHRACYDANHNAVNILLKHKADVKARDRHWHTPLHIAAANNAVQCAERLIPLVNINVTDRYLSQSIFRHILYLSSYSMVVKDDYAQSYYFTHSLFWVSLDKFTH